MVPAVRTDQAARSRAAAAIALAVFLIGSGAAVAVVLTGGPARPVVGPTRVAPLELVALGHERRGTTLAVHGVVRNPAGGARLEALSVTVYLVDPDGRVRAAMRGPVDAIDLAPGQTSAFAVDVPGADAVTRYRVSFETAAGSVEHIDRRTAGEGP